MFGPGDLNKYRRMRLRQLTTAKNGLCYYISGPHCLPRMFRSATAFTASSVSFACSTPVLQAFCTQYLSWSELNQSGYSP